MSIKRTEKCRYPSRYGGGWITGAQYITEYLCEAVQRQKKRGDLPQGFWQLPEWSKFFRSQIPTANKLLNDFPADVIIQTLRDKRVGYRIHSLRASWLLKPILKEKLALYEAQNKRLAESQLGALNEDEALAATTQQPQQIKGEKKSILSKLGDL